MKEKSIFIGIEKGYNIRLYYTWADAYKNRTYLA